MALGHGQVNDPHSFALIPGCDGIPPDCTGRFEPDVVILGINMPLANGYEVARVLRATSPRRQLIIAMTGASAMETAEKAKNAGIDVHLVKPVPVAAVSQLLARIEAPES